MKPNSGSIVTKNLSKRYSSSSTFALENLSISVEPGEVYGFLGPNGAGKSTAIKLLMNFIRPTSGQATILGKDVVQDAVAIKHSVGYLSGDASMYPKMTGRQFLTYMGDILPAVNKKYVDELEHRLKADTSKRLGELSRGNRQKVGIIQAFMHQPQILILDEPSSGLDPLMQEVFYDLIKEAKQRGATVFMSSHIMTEVQKVCDRVGIIKGGKLVTERNINEMASDAAQTFDIVFANKLPLAELKRLHGARVISHKESSVSIHMHGKLAPLFALLAKQEVTSIDARNLDLEEVFRGFYQDEGAGR